MRPTCLTCRVAEPGSESGLLTTAASGHPSAVWRNLEDCGCSSAWAVCPGFHSSGVEGEERREKGQEMEGVGVGRGRGKPACQHGPLTVEVWLGSHGLILAQLYLWHPPPRPPASVDLPVYRHKPS